MDGVDERPSEIGADVGESVDRLPDAGVDGVVEGVDPVAYLVDDVGLPLARRHPLRGPTTTKPAVDGPAGSDRLPARVMSPCRRDGLCMTAELVWLARVSERKPNPHDTDLLLHPTNEIGAHESAGQGLFIVSEGDLAR